MFAKQKKLVTLYLLNTEFSFISVTLYVIAIFGLAHLILLSLHNVLDFMISRCR